jgi:signal transduction histidine kinase
LAAITGVQPVAEQKELIASAISRAQADLAEALSELEKMSHFGAGSMAFATHALNNYLSVTGAAVQLISRRLEDHPDAQIRVWLEGLTHATELMGQIVSQMMSVSAAAEAKLRFEKVDVPGMVQRFCDFYARTAGQKSIRLNVDSSVAVPPAWTDRVAFASVFDNLLSNAIKYSKPGTQVWIRVRGEKGGVVCEVTDEGPGMDEKDQARLFQKGARLTPKPTGGESSTGYGLAVAKELMEKLRGDIWCESTLGQGSSFFIRLPVYQEPMPNSAFS